jgi:hypothetical protein
VSSSSMAKYTGDEGVKVMAVGFVRRLSVWLF